MLIILLLELQIAPLQNETNKLFQMQKKKSSKAKPVTCDSIYVNVNLLDMMQPYRFTNCFSDF